MAKPKCDKFCAWLVLFLKKLVSVLILKKTREKIKIINKKSF
tara:strand:- start:153 stop:278 length:126 start_codon:yes stop_codon:yes gene_type:complete